MIGSIAATAQTLNTARRLRTRLRLVAQICAASWHALAALLAAGMLDMVWPWPAVLRGLFLAALIGCLGFEVWRSRRRTRREMVREEQVAREIETRRPELDNALIHAVQFGPALALNPDDPSALLMRREVERGEREAARLPVAEVVERAPLRRERRVLLCTLGLLLATALLFPRVYRFEVPRLFAFWGDFPPFTLTDFEVSPQTAHIRSGEGLLVMVRVGGLQPQRLDLATGAQGDSGQSIPLTATDTGVYSAQLENLTRDTWYMAVADTGRSVRYWVHIDRNPRLRKLVVTYHPPAYTHRPDETIELGSNAEIHGLAGTKVDLDVEADQPLAAVNLALDRNGMPGLRLRLTPRRDAPTHAAASFTIERDGSFQIGLTAAANSLQTPDAARGKVTLQHDETPLVAITMPGQNVLARADMTVPLHIEAEDDIAVQRLELHRVVNRGQDTAQVFSVPNPARAVEQAALLDLKAMHAKPGDVIEYYATAYDNDPQGIHNASSDRYWVWVLSTDDYARMLARQRKPDQMMAQYQAQVDALRDLASAQAQLAQDMAANAAQARAHPNDPGVKAQTAALRQRQRALQDQAQDLARQMRDLAAQRAQYSVEKGLQTRLGQMAQALERAQRAMQAAQSAPLPGQMPPHAQAAARQMQQALNTSGQSVERTLQTLERALPLYRDFQRLQALARQQAELAQQARQVQQSLQNGKPDSFAQSRLQSLAAQQARNRDALEQLQQDLHAHAQDGQSTVPEVARTADQIAQAIRQKNIAQTMQGAQQALAGQDAGSGASQAEAARRALESLLRASQQGQQQAQHQSGQGIGGALAQMAQETGEGRESEGQGQTNGNNVPQPGSRPGDPGSGAQNGSTQQATVLGLAAQASAASARPDKNGLHGERFNAFSTDRRPTPTSVTPRTPSKGTDGEASHTPAEYRSLVRDYFKAVAEGR
jgi:hypothetical protein